MSQARADKYALLRVRCMYSKFADAVVDPSGCQSPRLQKVSGPLQICFVARLRHFRQWPLWPDLDDFQYRVCGFYEASSEANFWFAQWHGISPVVGKTVARALGAPVNAVGNKRRALDLASSSSKAVS